MEQQTFWGTPWETIIKEYRREKQGVRFPLLANYRDDFLDFVSTHETLFPVDVQNHYLDSLVQFYLRCVLQLIEEDIDQTIKQSDSIEEADIVQITRDVVQGMNENVKKKERLLNFDDDFVNEIREWLKTKINGAIQQMFGDLPLERTTKRLLSTLVINLLTRDCTGPLHTGLIFAGFGDEEFMPRLYAVNVEIILNAKIRAAVEDSLSHEIDHQEPAAIIPFAQSEMVHSFMDGVHPKMAELLDGIHTGVFAKFRDQVLSVTEEHDPLLYANLKDSLDDFVSSLVNELSSTLEEYMHKHSRPIVANVAALPKDELGTMAESLVNLTKFRRRISQDPETVSGPIDVAVISKGDGFIWVKHKHYFKPELNPRKMSIYSRSK